MATWKSAETLDSVTKEGINNILDNLHRHWIGNNQEWEWYMHAIKHSFFNRIDFEYYAHFKTSFYEEEED